MARKQQGSGGLRSGYPAGTRRLSVNLDEKLIKQAKRLALESDVSLTDLVSEILSKALCKEPDDPEGHAQAAS